MVGLRFFATQRLTNEVAAPIRADKLIANDMLGYKMTQPNCTSEVISNYTV